eukprot:11218568-Alexandrium_andersonii.AAC.1
MDSLLDDEVGEAAQDADNGEADPDEIGPAAKVSEVKRELEAFEKASSTADPPAKRVRLRQKTCVQVVRPEQLGQREIQIFPGKGWFGNYGELRKVLERPGELQDVPVGLEGSAKFCRGL